MLRKFNWELALALLLCIAIWLALGVRLYTYYRG